MSTRAERLKRLEARDITPHAWAEAFVREYERKHPGSWESLGYMPHADDGRFRPDHNVVDMLAQALAERDQWHATQLQTLREQLESVRSFLTDAPIGGSGYCCCGAPVDSHGMNDGHTPVDEVDYAVSCLRDEVQATLDATKPKHTGAADDKST